MMCGSLLYSFFLSFTEVSLTNKSSIYLMSPCRLAAEKPAFLHEDSGLPRVTAEAFPGLSRRLAQTHFYCFLTVKQSWASQGREINVMQ